MIDLLNYYVQFDINKYDEDDVKQLASWASDAYDRLYLLECKLKDANYRLNKINYLAEEV